MENRIKNYIGKIYIIGMFILYPLIMHDMYFDISNTKLITFYVLSALLILSVFIYAFVLRYKYLEKPKELILLGALSISMLITFMLNGHTSEILTSEAEYGTGLIFLFILILTSLSVLLIETGESAFFYSTAITLGVIAVSLFSTLQFIGLDPLGLLGAVAEDERSLFLGTIGNIGNLGCYAVMVFPLCFYSLAMTSEKYSALTKVLGGCGIFFCSILALISNTDGTILSFAVVVILLGIITLRRNDLAFYFHISLLLIGVAFTLVGLTQLIQDSRPLDIHERLLINPILLCVLICYSAIPLILHIKHRDTIINKISRIICIIALIALCILPIIIFTYTITNQRPDTLIGRVLYFDNHWGTDRGYLWKSAVRIFADSPISQKLFGLGSSGFADAYIDKFYNTSLELGIYSNYDAHNFFLHFLCEYGLVGLGLTMAFLIMRIKRNLINDNLFAKLKAISLIGAMVASMFLAFQNVTLGWLTVLL
ncbi:O-antigen ligase family protein [Pseudobutyrivibrio xylanivorans]|uniref:O-Antigen ligase n=1 Tax=Pseudobutyrivibrio xylanivorans DSM 14809 TaxID=1123012 RepID=A0A1M6JFK3_PSEXY|nr:O-antigen ligase family protein [Pseudobutyrivibrio xylanivorans]SHJ45496.1 O-Antigen ligase [Pseudobutyrivibrio xylanivorans DSM 14809]